MTNTLYYGDNLTIMRDNGLNDSVDLIYLDPPFNSKATYNVIFKTPKGHASEAQVAAFEDGIGDRKQKKNLPNWSVMPTQMSLK